MESSSIALEVVRRLIAATTAAEPDEKEIGALLADDVQHVTHPNAFIPNGSVEDRDAMLASSRRGAREMASQHWDIHELAEIAPGTVVVRATWTGQLLQGLAIRVRAEVAAFYTVNEGRVTRVETYDCFYPLGS
jgi:ketosteroid isomerase-like protein